MQQDVGSFIDVVEQLENPFAESNYLITLDTQEIVDPAVSSSLLQAMKKDTSCMTNTLLAH